MGKTLVVAEKPSVADEYARSLGESFKKQEGYLESDNWIVSWAIGHLVELAEPEDYDPRFKRWSITTLPVVPEQFKLKPDTRGKKQLDVLAKLLKRADVDRVVNGCDAGREGELIFAYILQWVKANKPVERLWVSSMTKQAIKSGFTALRPSSEFANLADAARSRSEADWLVGINGTRAATVRARSLGGVVSLGRVQTPTLALIVRRDAVIDAFIAEPYFLIEAHFALTGAAEPRRYAGRWFEGKDDRVLDRHRAEAIAAAASGAAALVESAKRTERRERPPLLYDLTALQREANSRFGMSASRTLAAAQRLYEGSTAGALITYPRTRSRFLPADQIPELASIAGKLAGYPQYRQAAEYVAGLAKLNLGRVVDDKKVEDHHAIIPTGELARKPLSGDDARVYDLVARRFLAVFHPDAVWEHTELVSEAGGERFRTRGKRLVEAGWRAAYDEQPEALADGERASEDDDESEQSLPRVEEGDRGLCELAEVLNRETKPPARYSEASLLSAMESAGKLVEDEELREAMKDSGLGTPATRAEVIEKLIAVGYIERQGKALQATSKGRQAIGLLEAHPVTSAELTGQWERRLGLIERGQDRRQSFMTDIQSFTQDLVDYFRELSPEAARSQRAVIGPCPNGDGEIRENRFAYGCSSWKSKEEPGCGFVIWKQVKGRSISPREARDLLEHGETEVLTGFRTTPNRGKLMIVGKEIHLVSEEGQRLDLPAAAGQTVGVCPRCGKEIRENSKAYGCSSWKSRKETGCGFVIWKSIQGHVVTPEEAAELLRTGSVGPVEFKYRKQSFAGRLVIQADQSVGVERLDKAA